MEKHAEDKSWSRVVKEHGLLPSDVRLSGEKGGGLREQAEALRQQAETELKRIEDVKVAIEQAEASRDWAGLETALTTYAELCPHDADVAERIEQARTAQDDTAWALAQDQAAACEAEQAYENLLSACEAYLNLYPEGKHAESANTRMDAIRTLMDDEAWALAQDQAAACEAREDLPGVLKIWQGHLKAWPSGRHAEDAKELLGKHVGQIKEQAASLSLEFRFRDAVHVLSQGLSVLPANKELADLKADMEFKLKTQPFTG